MVCAAVPVSLNSLNVFEPVIVFVAVDASRANQTTLYVVALLPANVIAVFDVLVNLIVPVLAVSVPAVLFHAVPVPVSVTMELPIVSVPNPRINDALVMLLFCVLSIPEEICIRLVLVRASCMVSVLPAAFWIYS